MEKKQRPLCCVLDFDETIAEVDSSQWVVDCAGVAPLYRHLTQRRGLPEHPAMNLLLPYIPLPTIVAALHRLPIRPETIAALRSAAAAGVELIILSDANSFFIDTVLRHHGIAGLFTAVHTNPAWIDVSGRLRYRSLAATAAPSDFCCGAVAEQDPLASPPAMPAHVCPLCPPNLCKGDVLDAGVLGRGTATAVVYAGDGRGDVCPALRLPGPDHLLLPRLGFPFHRLLPSYPGLSAAVRPWRSLGTALCDALQVPLHLPLPQLTPEADGGSRAGWRDEAAAGTPPEHVS